MTPQQVLQEVATCVVALGTPALVGVDGPDGAGKTTFADALETSLRNAGSQVVRASVDDFHHPRTHRHAAGRTPETVWLRHFDHEALLRELLHPWRAGAGAEYRRRWHDLATPIGDPARYVGAQQLYREQCVPRDHADVIIDNTNPREPTMLDQGPNA